MNPVFGSIPLHPEDPSALCTGAVDETRIEELLFGLGLVRWDDKERLQPVRHELSEWWRKPVSDRTIPRAYALLKLLFLPQELRLPSGEEVRVKPEPSLLPLLQAGRIGDACAIAQRRLVSAGTNPTRARLADVEDGIRLAAALLVPVHSIAKLTGLVLHGEAD
jgi:CRISPR-associated protein Csx17